MCHIHLTENVWIICLQNKSMNMTDRPLGVTIIGILWILLGICVLLAGTVFGAVFTLIAGVFGIVLGAIVIIIGLITLVLGLGCFKGWSWVWILGVIITGLNLLMGLIGLIFTGGVSVISLLLSIIILYYLFQPSVKAWFGTE